MRCTPPTSAKTSKIDAWRKFSSSALLSGASLTDPRCAQLSVYDRIYESPCIYTIELWTLLFYDDYDQDNGWFVCRPNIIRQVTVTLTLESQTKSRHYTLAIIYHAPSIIEEQSLMIILLDL